MVLMRAWKSEGVVSVAQGAEIQQDTMSIGSVKRNTPDRVSLSLHSAVLPTAARIWLQDAQWLLILVACYQN